MQIKVRQSAKGARYTAVIRIKRHGVIVHQEAQTFSRRALASDWGRRREVELEKPGAIDKARQGEVTVGALIRRYVKEFEPVAQWQRTKGADLKRLLSDDIALADALGLTSAQLVMHVRTRRAAGAGPATALNDLVWLGVLLRTAASAWALPTRPAVVTEAREACRALRLVAKAKQRDRVPTFDELAKLDAYFAEQDKRSEIPMRMVMWFAIYSARRQAEICRLERADDDADHQLGLVRDLKHPREKIGNHRRFRYTPKAWAILKMQPAGPRAFPYDAKSVGARFTRACNMLGIEDLRFHDLRHEATTRLFESGLSIQQVAEYTLHDSWAQLKRYTHTMKRGRVMEAPFL